MNEWSKRFEVVIKGFVGAVMPWKTKAGRCSSTCYPLVNVRLALIDATEFHPCVFHVSNQYKFKE
jgi:hypothetical protein